MLLVVLYIFASLSVLCVDCDFDFTEKDWQCGCNSFYGIFPPAVQYLLTFGIPLVLAIVTYIISNKKK